jgi:hypothetical protein
MVAIFISCSQRHKKWHANYFQRDVRWCDALYHTIESRFYWVHFFPLRRFLIKNYLRASNFKLHCLSGFYLFHHWTQPKILKSLLDDVSRLHSQKANLLNFDVCISIISFDYNFGAFLVYQLELVFSFVFSVRDFHFGDLSEYMLLRISYPWQTCP